MQRTAVAMCLVLSLCGTAFAKAYYAGKAEMIGKAEAIVVVNITKVEAAHQKGGSWLYSQKATATVEQCLKGGLAGEITLYGGGNFICARCDFKTGRFLLFLRKDGRLWAGSNWHLGVRPIKGGKVEWFKDDKSVFEMTGQPLADVLAQIQKTLAAAKP